MSSGGDIRPARAERLRGKTSTLESLEGNQASRRGKAFHCGVDPVRQPGRLRNIIGVQLQTSALPPAMTVEEALVFFSSYHGVAARYDLIERLGLAEKKRLQYGKLSVGQQRRLALANCHRPQSHGGLPRRAHGRVGRAVTHGPAHPGARAAEKGATVILATHDMAEAEKLADRAANTRAREIVALGSPPPAHRRRRTGGRASPCHRAGEALRGAGRRSVALLHARENGYSTYLSEDPGKSVSAILSWIEKSGDALIDLRVERPTLEERFLELTQDKSTQGAAL